MAPENDDEQYDPLTDPYHIDSGDDPVETLPPAPLASTNGHHESQPESPPVPPETLSTLELLLDEMVEESDAWGYVQSIIDRDTPTSMRHQFYQRWIAMVADRSRAERDMLIARGRQCFTGTSAETMRHDIDQLVERGATQAKTAASMLTDDYVLEMINTPEGLRYLVFKSSDGTHEIEENYVAGETNYTLPLVESLVHSGSLLLPTGIEEYGDTDTLRARLCDHIRKYVHLPETDILLAAQYVMSSWHADRIPFAPYLFAVGVFESGKSRLLDVLGEIVMRGLIAAGSLTSAVLYRALDLARATLVIDEADFDARDPAWPDIKKILLNGSMRRRSILRTDMDAKGAIRGFDPFGRKIFASRAQFMDDALRSRGILINMEEDDTVIGDVDLDLILPDEFYTEAQALRNQLLLYRLRTVRTITVNTKQRFMEQGITSPRVTQAAIALLAGVDNAQVRAAILKRLRGASKAVAVAKTMEPAALFISALLKRYDSKPGDVPVVDVLRIMIGRGDLDERARVQDVTAISDNIQGVKKKRKNDGTYYLLDDASAAALRRRIGKSRVESTRVTGPQPSRRQPV
jgi:hypothetical protein